MADKVIINVEFESRRNNPETNGQGRSKNTRKRKRVALFPEKMSVQDKEAQIEAFQKELNGLFGYFKEVKDQKVHIELSECRSTNAVIAVLMEESHLPLSSLIYEICDNLNKANELVPEPVTHASVKTSVLFVGQRLMYGVPNPDADVLEDDSQSCFWCWETRDLKLFPKSVRGQFVIRRTCRRRIRERIIAISEMIAALKKPESDHDYYQGLIKASEKLSKAFPEADIRSLVDGLLQKNSIDLAKKEAKQEEKLILKQLKDNMREVEREIKSKHNEILCAEKDLEGEARKDERSCENNGSERMKHQRKHQGETEKDKRRREKAEAEMKEKRSLQKQASLMERFVKRHKASPSCQNDQFTKAGTSGSSSRGTENVSDSVTISMDCTLALHHEVTIEDIQRSHWSSWRQLGHSVRSSRKQGWGLRQKPRTELSKQARTAIGAVVCDNELVLKKAIDGWKEQIPNDRSHITDAEKSLLCARKFCHRKQLLQFDNSHRPAFYGIWLKKSHVVGPRHPFKKDPSLDYDVSSDEEWEEEDPGESLSDLDKDEEESLEECSKSDDEGEDGFFVPDGYLSEDEGALVDRMERDIDIEGLGSSPSCKDDLESDEFYALLRQQKYLANLTEHALRKNQPLIIQNLVHGEDSLFMAHNLGGTPKLEQMCLQALCMQMIPGSSYIEISVDIRLGEDQETCLSPGEDTAASASDMAGIPESDLLAIIVTTIQTCSKGMNKVLESLQQKFPAVSKSLLRNKVREVSDYVDNRLQVKKEVLLRLGLALYPEKKSRGATSIATFFSKRCLPPTSECMNPCETSPVPSRKSNSGAHESELNM